MKKETGYFVALLVVCALSWLIIVDLKNDISNLEDELRACESKLDESISSIHHENDNYKLCLDKLSECRTTLNIVSADLGVCRGWLQYYEDEYNNCNSNAYCLYWSQECRSCVFDIPTVKSFGGYSDELYDYCIEVTGVFE